MTEPAAPGAMRFEIDPDITVARTLQAAFYRSEAVFAEVRERVFVPSWQWLGRVDDVAAPASFAPRELLPGLLDEPLLLARDETGTLRCLSNVCTPPRQPARQRAGPGGADPLRLPRQALRPRRPHALHARLRGRARLPGPLRRSARIPVRHLGRAWLRVAGSDVTAGRARSRRCASASAGWRSARSSPMRSARAISRSTPIGRCMSRTTSRGCTSPSSTRP